MGSWRGVREHVCLVGHRYSDIPTALKELTDSVNTLMLNAIIANAPDKAGRFLKHGTAGDDNDDCKVS